MSNRVGSSTTYTYILPRGNNLRSVSLSREAKHRLRVIEYYLNCSSVALTCRHFGITRSYFYKWHKRFNPRDLRCLQDLSRRPHKVRGVTYSYEFIKIIRKLRTDYPRFSAKKLAGPTGFEPAISSVTGRRDKPLHYEPLYITAAIIPEYGLYINNRFNNRA